MVRFERSILVVAAALMVLGAPRATRAEVYDVPILVDNEEDIIDLFESGAISEGERDLLIDLLQDKIDLNEADRDTLFELPGVTYGIADAILAARKDRNWFKSVADLEDVVGLPSDVLEQIRPFLYVVSRTPPPPPIGGSVRVKVADSFGDDAGPVAYTRLRLDGWDGMVGAGYVGILHEEPGRLSAVRPGGTADPYFIADAPEYTFEYLAKAYLYLDTDLWDNVHGSFIAGSYTAGFGERLVFDTTTRRRPNGWYSDDVVYESIDSKKADFQPRKGQFGAAFELRGISLADSVWIDFTGMFSWWRFDNYQYDYTPNRTYLSEAAAAGGEDGCYKEGRCFAYETFPDVFSEILAGGNSTVHFGTRSHVGVTGYWAKTQFEVGDDFVTWTPSAGFPARSSFWAVGGDAAWGTGIVDLFAEYARTDSGGNGAVLRSVLDLDPVDLEISGRFYDKSFDNPHARGEAAPDEYLGRRARDEAGGRVRVVAKLFPWWRLQSIANMWVHPTIDRIDMELLMRHDFQPLRELRLSSWAKYNDKDIAAGGRDEDYAASTDYEFDPDSAFATVDPDKAAEEALANATSFARGMKVDWGAQATTRFIPLTTVTAYFKMSWADITRKDRTLGVDFYGDRFERSYNTWLRVAVSPLPWLGFATRIKLLDEDIDEIGGPRGNELWEWYARVDFKILKWVKGYVRYDLRKYIDDTPPDPNPEHVIRGVVDVKF